MPGALRHHGESNGHRSRSLASKCARMESMGLYVDGCCGVPGGDSCYLVWHVGSGMIGWIGLAVRMVGMIRLLLGSSILTAGSTCHVKMGEPDFSNPPMDLSLAAVLEGDQRIRNRLRSTGQVTQWLSDSAVGVKSCKAMALNHAPLELMALWWCPRNPAGVTAITIPMMRKEVWIWNMC